MSRETVRSSIEAYLNLGIAQPNPAIPYLSQVFPYAPKLTQNGEFFTNVEPGSGIGAIMYIYIGDANDSRIGTQGTHGGRKQRLYEVSLVSFLRNTGKDVPGVYDAAQASDNANDDYLQGVESWIRADRTAGTGAGGTGTRYVFQWGEGDTKGSPDIDTKSDLPRQMNLGITQVFSIIRVKTIEILDT